MVSAFEKRPKLLTPFVVILFMLDTLSYLDTPDLAPVQAVGLIALTLLMLPFYIGLYIGKDWARWTMVTLLSLTIGVMAFSFFRGDISAANDWQMVFYSSEALFSFLFIIWVFLPIPARFFRDRRDSISFDLIPKPASILRKFGAFWIDILVAFIVFVLIERVSFIITPAAWMKLVAASSALVFYVVLNWKNVGVGQLLFKVKTVSRSGGTVALWKHALRPVYAVLFSFISVGLCLADTHHRGIHDYIFGTVVARR
ncbi:MAG: RDD family protein [Bacteriovoracaceae bacterium]|nr:RDD family protein [Bacteriovoracaceae bacterium]